jgi:hypothetical protein
VKFTSSNLYDAFSLTIAKSLQVEEKALGQILLFSNFIYAKNGFTCLSFALGTKNLT